MSAKNQEELLQAWIRMSVCIRGNRILTDMSMNEMMICGLLYERQQAGSEDLTAKELCERTRLLKSQMNKILSDMEAAGMIERFRCEEDRRRVYIRMKEGHVRHYMEEHRRIMEVMAAVDRELGEEKMRELTNLVQTATQVVDRFQSGESRDAQASVE